MIKEVKFSIPRFSDVIRQRCLVFLSNIRALAEKPFESTTLYQVSDLCNAPGKTYQDQIPIRFYRGSLFRSLLSLWGIYGRAILASSWRRNAAAPSMRSSTRLSPWHSS
jgi:hypothetical protein